MKTLQIVIILVSLTASGQNTADNILFEKANLYLEAAYSNDKSILQTDEDKIAVKALKDIEKYATQKANENFKMLVQKYPESKHFIGSLFNIGDYDLLQKKYAQSKENLLTVIQSNDSENKHYQRMAYFDLAQIAIIEKDILLAKKYVEEVNKSKPQYYFCGVARETDENSLKFLNARLEALIKEK